MFVLPYDANGQRTNVISFTPTPPEHAVADQTPAPLQSAEQPPEIVNFQAQVLAKRQKFTPTGAQLFDTLKVYFDEHFNDSDVDSSEEEREIPFAQIATRLQTTYPELYNWALHNGPMAREQTLEYGSDKNPQLNKDVQEALYWLPLASAKDTPLHPDSLFARLRKLVRAGKGPEDIAQTLNSPRNRPFLHGIIQTPLSELHEKSLQFFAHDPVKELYLAILDRVYLLALEMSEVMNHARTTEASIDQQLCIALPSGWTHILQTDCSTWADVQDALDTILADPLSKESRLRALTLALSSMHSSFELTEELLKEQLSFLVDRAFNMDQLAPVFPQCQEKLPELLLRLDQCRQKFSPSLYLERAYAQIKECQPHSSKLPTAAGEFIFNHDRLLYDTALKVIHDCLANSTMEEYNSWPNKLKSSFAEALKQTPPLTQEELLDQLNKNPELREQFLYRLSTECLNKDPNELIQEKIIELRDQDLRNLSQLMGIAGPEERHEVLHGFLLTNQTLPWNLTSLIDWAQL